MGTFAALDVSQEETAICVVGPDGGLVTEAKVPTCPDAIADWLAEWAGEWAPQQVHAFQRRTAEAAGRALRAAPRPRERLPIPCFDHSRMASLVCTYWPNRREAAKLAKLWNVARTD